MKLTKCPLCGAIFRAKRSTAVYCCDAHRVAASRQKRPKECRREAVEGLVTLRPSDTPPLAPVTLTEPISPASKPRWRWYERLDGSCDLYCDSEMNTRHVARIVWRNGSYRLDKPSGLTSEVWTDCRVAWDAIRDLMKQRVTLSANGPPVAAETV